MSATTQQNHPITQRQSRSVNAIGLTLAVVTLLAAVIYFYLANRLGAWQLYLSGASLAGLGILAVVVGRFPRWKNSGQRPIHLLAGVWIAGLINALLIDNEGLLVGLLIVLATLTIATISIPSQRTVNISIALSAVAGLIAGACDAFVIPFQLKVPALQPLIPFMAAALILAFGAIIVLYFRSYSLPNKLMVAFFFVTLISSGMVVAVANMMAGAILRTEIGTSLDTLTNSQAVEIGNSLNQQLGSLQSLANAIASDINVFNHDYPANATPESIREAIARKNQRWIQEGQLNFDVKTALYNRVAKTLGEYRTLFPDNLDLLVTDQYGAAVAMTDFVSFCDQSSQPWWSASYNSGRGAAYVGALTYNLDSGSYMLITAVPVRDHTTGQIIGVLRTNYRMDSIIGPLSTVKLGETGRLALYLPGNQVPDPANKTIARGVLSGDQWQQLYAAEQGYLLMPYGETQSLVAQELVRPLDAPSDNVVSSQGWRIVAYQDQSEALAPVNSTSRALFLMILLALLLAALAAPTLSRVLADPIVRLTAAAGRVASGDLEVQAPVESTDEIGQLGEAFNMMTMELKETLENLERRVADRTRDLDLSAQISRRLSTVLDERQLVYEVIDQLQQAYNFYHVHIYLFDDANEYLVLAGGTGEAGKALMEKHHKLARGKGMVGRAAETNSIVLASDVTQQPAWLPNPLLPETRSEMAVPISLGELVMGVLDVQHNQVGGLKESHAEMIQSMANQVAIALQNSRLFAMAQSEAENQVMVGEIARQIQSTTNLADAMQTAVRELGRAVKARQASVKLTNR